MKRTKFRRLPHWSETSNKSPILFQEHLQLIKHLHRGLQRVWGWEWGVMSVKWRRGIYRARKQRTSSPMGIHLRTIHQQSKGCFVHPGIIQQSIQKVAYVQYFGAYVCVHILIIWCTICQHTFGGPPTYVHTKRQERMSTKPSVRSH
jgi:hypothetical protein